MKKTFNSKKIQYFCTVIGIAMLPVLSAVLMCITQNMTIQELYLPNAVNFDWNDEVFYYKQIEGIKDFGLPQGYFGYNESHAIYGTLGAWSPFLYIFFCLYSRFLGWNFLAPVWCNLLLLTVAMGIFALRLHPDLKQMVGIYGVYLAFTPVTRFSFLCMPEVTVIFLLILFCAVWFPRKMNEDGQSYGGNGIFSWWELLILYMIVSLLVLMRPYYILLLIPIGCQVYQKTKSKMAVGLNLLYGVAILMVFLQLTAKLCAAYFAPTIDLSWLQALRQDFKTGLFQIAYILLSSFKNFFMQCGLGITDNSIAGGIFAVYLMLMLFLFYEAYVHRHESRIAVSWGGWFLCFFCMLCIKFLCYTVGSGYRHLMGFVVIGSLICVAFIPTKKSIGFLIIGMFWCFVVKAETTCEVLPAVTDEMVSEMEAGVSALQDKIFIDSSADPWENTVIWLYLDEAFIKWQDLYALPSGVGINLCTKQYVLEHFDDLHSKYIMTDIGGDVDLKCQQEERELLAEYGEVHVWELH